MVTRVDFIYKLLTWLSFETCRALASEAERRFAPTETMSVYELMLIRMASGDAEDFKDMCDDCGIKLRSDDNIDGMYNDMINEW